MNHSNHDDGLYPDCAECYPTDPIDGQETVTHPYYVEKARKAMREAGGDPDRSAKLAAWAQEAKRRDKPPHGCVIDTDGEILAETVHTSGPVGATYIDNAGTKKYNLFANVLDLALPVISTQIGNNVMYIRMSQFTGPSSRTLNAQREGGN